MTVFYHMSGIFFFLQRLRSANLTRYLYAAQAATLIKAQYET